MRLFACENEWFMRKLIRWIPFVGEMEDACFLLGTVGGGKEVSFYTKALNLREDLVFKLISK